MRATSNTCELPGDIRLTRDQLVAFVHDLLNRKSRYAGPERRSAKRHVVIMDVPAVPLDKAMRPAGDPFVAISRNISTTGISLFHTAQIHAPYLALELRDEVKATSIRAAIEVVRCAAKGQLFEIAGKFVYKIYEQQ
jgi:hypothetical protein